MLFNATLRQYASQISTLETKIESLEAQLQQIRDEKSELEAEVQNIRTLEGAAESAYAQAQNFIAAAERLGRTDLVKTFWQAMTGLRSGAIAALPAEGGDPEEPTSQPEPTPTPNNGPSALGVTDSGSDEAIVEVDIAAPTTQRFLASAKPTAADRLEERAIEKAPTTAEGKENAGVLSLDELSRLTIQQLRRLASIKGVDTKGKRYQIAERLDGKVTRNEVTALTT